MDSKYMLEATRARHLGSTTLRAPRQTLHVALGRERDPAEMGQAALAKKAHVGLRAGADSISHPRVIPECVCNMCIVEPSHRSRFFA